MRFFGLFILIFLWGFVLPKNTLNTKDELIWNSGRLLNWNDFKKQPNHSNIGNDAALTVSSIQVQTYISDKLLKLNVTSKFYPYQSWIIKDKQSDGLLKHEQLHFDITELYARIIRKEIIENIIYKKDYTQIGSIVNKNTKEWNKTQETYDSESSHNRNPEMQEKWNKYIADQLIKYADYSQPELNILLK